MLMIHGLGGTSNVWTPVLPAMSRQQAIRPDLPGSGRSRRVEGPLSIDRFVPGEAAPWGAARRAIEKAHVVGHSMGTIAGDPPRRRRAGQGQEPRALRPAARARRSRVRANIRARGENRARRAKQGCKRSPTAWSRRRSRPSAQAPHGGGGRRARADDAPVPGRLRPLLRGTRGHPVRGSPRSMPHAARHRRRRRGRAPAVSAQDRREDPRRRVTMLPRCGHWTMVEKPDECDDLLRRFYAQRM